METRNLGPLGAVSALTLGGGGIGALWGPTTREEGIATLREAVDTGITVLDAAPGYNVCEELIGEAFDGRLPEGVLLTTKCGIGNPEPGSVLATFRTSLTASLTAMRVDYVDAFFLHGHIGPPPGAPAADAAGRDLSTYTPWDIYTDEVIPAFDALVADGLIRHWALTGVDTPEAIIAAVSAQNRPAAIQAVANLLDSPGSLTGGMAGPRPRDIIAAAHEAGVGVMGIRAVQAGALTAAFDRDMPADSPDGRDYALAAPFRELCATWGEDPAIVAHRYALHLDGVDTLILGVKDRAELRAAVAFEAAGPLDAAQVEAIDALGLRTD
jgi:aryl-alcohol dehydrogenase-like predicted oxidoreductase